MNSLKDFENPIGHGPGEGPLRRSGQAGTETWKKLVPIRFGLSPDVYRAFYIFVYPFGALTDQATGFYQPSIKMSWIVLAGSPSHIVYGL